VGRTQNTRSERARKPEACKLPILPIIGGVVAVALIVTILLTFSGDDDAAAAFGEPVVTGTALPPAIENESDAAIGLRIPAIGGADFDANPVSISPDDGRAKVILFIAHWCPFCQSEVPVVQDFVAAGGVPAEVDFYSVTTGISPTRENYPPSEWLEREEWNLPVIVDDSGSTVAAAFGLTAYPYWVFVDDQGNVMGRITGGVGENLPLLFERIAADGTS